MKRIAGLPDNIYNARWMARLLQKSYPGENGCILVKGFHNADGYANVYHRTLGDFPHRVIMILTHGPIAPGLMACHKCGNHGCVNPDHLYIGTMQQNARDTVAMGRHRESQKTHCPKGHPLSGDNVVMVGPRKTKRQCQACQRERHASRWGELTPEQKARIYIRRNIYRRAKAAQLRAEVSNGS